METFLPSMRGQLRILCHGICYNIPTSISTSASLVRDEEKGLDCVRGVSREGPRSDRNACRFNMLTAPAVKKPEEVRDDCEGSGYEAR